jgi:hypothetical protein
MARVAEMSWLGPLLLLVAAIPALMFASHVVVHRALAAAGRRPTGHSSAFRALAAAAVPMFATAWWLGVTLCGFAYLAAVYGALAILYIDVVNIAETSLHMHVLLELAWNRGTKTADLLDRYSPERMIAARLERLASIGQVRIVDGRAVIADRSTLRVAAAIDAWRVVLGLPTTPPGAAARARGAAVADPSL